MPTSFIYYRCLFQLVLQNLVFCFTHISKASTGYFLVGLFLKCSGVLCSNFVASREPHPRSWKLHKVFIANFIQHLINMKRRGKTMVLCTSFIFERTFNDARAKVTVSTCTALPKSRTYLSRNMYHKCITYAFCSRSVWDFIQSNGPQFLQGTFEKKLLRSVIAIIHGSIFVCSQLKL